MCVCICVKCKDKKKQNGWQLSVTVPVTRFKDMFKRFALFVNVPCLKVGDVHSFKMYKLFT